MEILYQDKRILVALKPAGVLSTDEPGGMPALLRAALHDPQACIRTVHRLDRVVSGVMVFARSRMAATLLSQQVRERRFTKQYLAVLHGSPETQSGTFTDLLLRDRYTQRTQVVDAPGKSVQEAVLDYVVLGARDGLSLVKIQLHTGRTHQIRVQFSSRGLPLVGDRKYGMAGDACEIALWSACLAFQHPESGENMRFFHVPPMQYPWNLFEETLQSVFSES